MFGCMSGRSAGVSARRASISAFCCASSPILAFMAGWYIPSSMASMIPLMLLNLLKGATIRFGLRSPFMVLAVGLLGIGAHRDRHSLGRYQLVGEPRQYAPL